MVHRPGEPPSGSAPAHDSRMGVGASTEGTRALALICPVPSLWPPWRLPERKVLLGERGEPLSFTVVPVSPQESHVLFFCCCWFLFFFFSFFVPLCPSLVHLWFSWPEVTVPSTPQCPECFPRPAHSSMVLVWTSICTKCCLLISLYRVSNKFLEILPDFRLSFAEMVAPLGGSEPAYPRSPLPPCCAPFLIPRARGGNRPGWASWSMSPATRGLSSLSLGTASSSASQVTA